MITLKKGKTNSVFSDPVGGENESLFSNSELFSEVETAAVTKLGVTLTDPLCHVDWEGMAASWVIPGWAVPGAGEASVGVTNSCEKSRGPQFAARLYFGVIADGVGVPLLVSDVGKYGKKYKLPARETIETCLSFLLKSPERLAEEVHYADVKHVPYERADLLLAEASRSRYTPASRAMRAGEEYRKGPPSAWRLLKCFAFEAKKNNPALQLRGGVDFYHLILGVGRKER